MPNVNKIKYGLKNVHAAIQTETEGVYTYAAPTAIPGAVSLSLEAQGEAEPFYADDCEYYVSAGNNGYSGDLEIALIPEWFRTNILQETKDSKRSNSPCCLSSPETSKQPATSCITAPLPVPQSALRPRRKTSSLRQRA